MLKKTGGARIGMANATWPFATLNVDHKKLELKAQILGNLVFSSNDIVSIEPYGLIPILGQGIKINHKVKSYNSKVIFWTMGSPEKLIQEIENTGFFNQSTDSTQTEKEINQNRTNTGFPIKTEAAIFIVIVWNILFGFDFINFFRKAQEGSPLGAGSSLATGLLLLLSFLVLNSAHIRTLVLKKGVCVDDIKIFLYFIMFVSGMIFIST